jgi:lysophospholipase L1-like esterase
MSGYEEFLSPLKVPAFPPALRPLYAAIANRDNASCKILVDGDSISEGEQCSNYTQRWVNRWQDMLRGAFPTAGVRGGPGYFPTHYVASLIAPPAQFDLTANLGGTSATTVDTRYGLGGRSRQLVHGAAMMWTYPCTSFKVHYAKDTFGVQANVFVDGVSVGNFNCNGAAAGGFTFTSGQLTPGIHTIKVATIDNVGFISTLSGVEFFYGDETKGIRVYDGSRSGAVAATFDAVMMASITTIAPQCIIVPLIANDSFANSSATYTTDLAAHLTRLDTAITNAGAYPCSIILMAMSERSDGTVEVFPNYVKVMRDLADSRGGNTIFFDMGDWLGSKVSTDPLGLWADAVHMSIKGQALTADRVMHGLGLNGGGEARLGGNKLHVILDFGNLSGQEEDTTAQTTVADPYIQSSSVVQVSLAGSTADHDPEDGVIEGITLGVGNIVAGVSYDIFASAPDGTWGKYLVAANY